MKRSILLLILSFALNLFADGVMSEGTGTQGNPYLIATLDNLLWVSTNSQSWSSHFIQTADIDASDTQNWNDGIGFSPIGSSTIDFTGTYNGNGFNIQNLYINEPFMGGKGLFGYIYGATIKNLGVENINLVGGVFVGGLIAYCYSSFVTQCYSTGNISGHLDVGGLIGHTQASEPNDYYETTNCYSTVVVSSSNGNAGGFVGYNSYAYIIRNCFSSGNVTSINGSYVGGFAGRNDQSSSITNCYSTGDVIGGSYIGGFLGKNDDGSLVQNCYSVGVVSGASNLGGFVSWNYESSVLNSFWDLESSNQNTSGAGLGKLTSEMKDYSTFINAGWDFVGEAINGSDDYWDADQTWLENDGYMILFWQDGSDDTLPVGLSSFTAIQTAANFAQLNWQTQSETNLYGYNVYRGLSNDIQETLKVNYSLISPTNSSNVSNYTFVDNSVELDNTYYFWLESIDLDCTNEMFGPVTVTIKEESNEISDLPSRTELFSAFPNPFNPTTTIKFNVSEFDEAVLVIYNLMGQRVKSYPKFSSGNYSVIWDGKNNNNKNVSSGVYFYKLQSESYKKVDKVILLK